MTGQGSSDDTDWIWLVIIGAFFLSSGGAALIFTYLLDPAVAWLVGAGALTSGPSVVIPLADGVGLDWLRIAIVAVALALVIAAIAMVAARRGGEQAGKDRRR